MAGTVTATAGKIGDWVITGSNMESDTDYYRGIKFKPSDAAEIINNDKSDFQADFDDDISDKMDF